MGARATLGVWSLRVNSDVGPRGLPGVSPAAWRKWRARRKRRQARRKRCRAILPARQPGAGRHLAPATGRQTGTPRGSPQQGSISRLPAQWQQKHGPSERFLLPIPFPLSPPRAPKKPQKAAAACRTKTWGCTRSADTNLCHHNTVALPLTSRPRPSVVGAQFKPLPCHAAPWAQHLAFKMVIGMCEAPPPPHLSGPCGQKPPHAVRAAPPPPPLPTTLPVTPPRSLPTG